MSEQTRCATVEVPEDRSDPQGRKVALQVVVVPAISDHPEADPLFFLAGGPGQSSIDVAPKVMDALWYVHRSRDIVFVDQRGTGRSNPLDCDFEPEALGELLEVAIEPDLLRSCLTALDADPRQYSTKAAADDLDAVRQFLGYPQVNLLGASYGTRLGLAYARWYPVTTRSLVLTGVAPPQVPLTLHFATDAQRALDATFQACTDDPKCAEAFPDLPTQLEAVLDSLGGPVRARDPLNGTLGEIQLNRDMVTALIRGLLYDPITSSLLPLAIAEAHGGNFDPLMAMAHTATSTVEDSMSTGLMLSVLCAEDLPRFDETEARRAADGTFVGDLIPRVMRDACEIWPRGEVQADTFEPVSFAGPTLLLSGDLDPVTPPRWADEAKRTLADAVHLTAPGGGHSVLAQGCLPRVVEAFIDGGTAAADAERACVEDIVRPPFFLDFAGPEP